MSYKNRCSIDALIGKTIVSADVFEDTISFYLSSGEKFQMFHDQDCCESVYIESINGNIIDLVGEPILKACEYNSDDAKPASEYTDSYTWTFYSIATCKGEVDIRWYGESSGYYSEGVDCELIPAKE